jgi:uncharacterized cupredoxin-like copper-binding protein
MKNYLKAALTLSLVSWYTPAVAQPTDFSQAPVIEISLSNFKFTPNLIHLKAGQPIILRLTNAASGGHDFAAPTFFSAATVRHADLSVIHDGKIEFASHQTVDIALVPAVGHYALKCDHPLHAFIGMKGEIIVE